MKNLRQILGAIVLAAPLTGCLFAGTNCSSAPDEVFLDLPPMPDMRVAALIQACQQQQDCEPLCKELYLEDNGFEPSTLVKCALATDPNTNMDAVDVETPHLCIGGRRPANYRRGRQHGPAVAAYLAQQAELEAASVRAFGDTHADLAALGAPRALQRAMIAAAGDEVRHARTCGALACRHGATPRIAPIAPAARRSRRQLAIDNVVEGCVRETYGAVIAGFQARAAGDRAIRRAMTGIARDEARHAALSWRLHRWLAPRLDRGEHAAVAASARAARAELRPTEVAPALRAVVGLPDAATGTALLGELDRAVWRGI